MDTIRAFVVDRRPQGKKRTIYLEDEKYASLKKKFDIWTRALETTEEIEVKQQTPGFHGLLANYILEHEKILEVGQALSNAARASEMPILTIEQQQKLHRATESFQQSLQKLKSFVDLNCAIERFQHSRLRHDFDELTRMLRGLHPVRLVNNEQRRSLRLIFYAELTRAIERHQQTRLWRHANWIVEILEAMQWIEIVRVIVKPSHNADVSTEVTIQSWTLPELEEELHQKGAEFAELPPLPDPREDELERLRREVERLRESGAQ